MAVMNAVCILVGCSMSISFFYVSVNVIAVNFTPHFPCVPVHSCVDAQLCRSVACPDSTSRLLRANLYDRACGMLTAQLYLPG